MANAIWKEDDSLGYRRFSKRAEPFDYIIAFNTDNESVIFLRCDGTKLEQVLDKSTAGNNPHAGWIAYTAKQAVSPFPRPMMLDELDDFINDMNYHASTLGNDISGNAKRSLDLQAGQARK